MSGDDDLASVRIEVDGASAGGPADAPEVAPKSPGGGSTWVLILALVAVGAIVATILALRPSQDEAADGSARSIPTTTVPEADDEDTGDAGDDEQADEAESNEVAPILVNSDSEVSQIVPAGVGLLGIVDGPPSATPEIVRSFDGLDWFDFEATVTTSDGPNATQLNWFRLLEFDDGFMLAAIDVAATGVPTTRAFVSEDGSEWVEFDLQGPTDTAFFLTNTSSTSFFGLRFRAGGVESFLADHSTLEVPEVGVCDISPQVFGDSRPRTFDVIDCTGEVVGVLDAATVQAAFVADDVLDCAGAIGSVAISGGFEFVRLDRAGEFTSLGRAVPGDLPTDLPAGGVALVDFGVLADDDLGPCDEFLEVEPRSAAIIVADDSSSEANRFEFPSERAPFPGESPIPFDDAVNIVGEVVVGDGRYLIVQFDEDLRALDLDSGVWSGSLASPDTPIPETSGYRVTLTESGSRAFAINNSLLLTFDFVANAAGGLEVVETIQPMSLTLGPGAGANFTESLYATDDLFFIAEDNLMWAVEAPPVPSE